MHQVFPFLELPYHVRHKIYTLALDYPDLDPVFTLIDTQNSAAEDEHFSTKLPKCVLPAPHVPERLRTTPGIMLCNRQTAREAQEAMRSKTFTLKRPPPSPATLARPMDITEFISEDTLKGIRQVNFIMNLYGGPSDWLKTMETLLDVWSIESHLRRIHVTLEQPHQLPLGQFWHPNYGHSALRTLSMVRISLRHRLLTPL